MRLLHYSEKPLERVRHACQHIEYDDGAFKPIGLWVSIDGEDDWRSWCEAENYQLHNLNFAHEITLKPDANIRVISNAIDLLSFSKTYTVKRYPDWSRVADAHDGIIIAPYQWRLRTNLKWYYSWDCASGCIWNADAIDGVTRLSQPEEPLP